MGSDGNIKETPILVAAPGYTTVYNWPARRLTSPAQEEIPLMGARFRLKSDFAMLHQFDEQTGNDFEAMDTSKLRIDLDSGAVRP